LDQAAHPSKASAKDKFKSKSEPGSESEDADDTPLAIPSSSSLTIKTNKKIIADLRSSLLADTTAYENARSESLNTFRRKEVRYLIYFLLC
jgi:hypothetical protein